MVTTLASQQLLQSMGQHTDILRHYRMEEKGGEMITSSRIQEIFQPLKKYADNLLKLELLVFWSRYPNTKFGINAITRVLNRRRDEVEGALKGMELAGIVEEAPHPGFLNCYSLARGGEMRQSVLSLSGHTLDEIKNCFVMQWKEPYRSF